MHDGCVEFEEFILEIADYKNGQVDVAAEKLSESRYQLGRQAVLTRLRARFVACGETLGNLILGFREALCGLR